MQPTDQHVARYFDTSTRYWDQVYGSPSLQGEIYRLREASVLSLISETDLPPGAQVLEVGPGSGRITLALARQGQQVEAIDSSPEMLQSLADRIAAEGLSDKVTLAQRDASATGRADASADLVVAIGVLPWLSEPQSACVEFSRILRPGGHLIMTADNRHRMVSFIDPRAMLAASPLRLAVERVRARRGRAMSHLHSPKEVSRMLQAAGLRLERDLCVGFGPFQFLGRNLLSEQAGLATHSWLQARADGELPLLRGTGWQYLLRAAKP